MVWIHCFAYPSSDNITIQPATNSKGKEIKKSLEIREIELVDKMGMVRHRQKFAKGTTTQNLSVNTLPNDLYVLRIFDGKTWHSPQSANPALKN